MIGTRTRTRTRFFLNMMSVTNTDLNTMNKQEAKLQDFKWSFCRFLVTLYRTSVDKTHKNIVYTNTHTQRGLRDSFLSWTQFQTHPYTSTRAHVVEVNPQIRRLVILVSESRWPVTLVKLSDRSTGDQMKRAWAHRVTSLKHTNWSEKWEKTGSS